MKAKVISIQDETPNIKLITLAPLDQLNFPSFSAGAHVNLTLPSGLVRQYSICNPVSENTPPASYRLAVKREEDSRGGSIEAHNLVAGSVVDVSHPLNLFPLADEAEFHIFIAAGIGITPLFAMAAQLRDHHNFSLLYFSRSRTEAALLEELEALIPDNLSCFFDDDTPPELAPAITQVLTNSLGGKDEADQRRSPSSIHFYVCGPPGFMNAAIEIAQSYLPTSSIHFELFQPPQHTPRADAPDSALTVECDGETFSVPATHSIAEVLQDNDVPLLTSCEEGICGTCIMQVLDGTPDHRDSCLTDEDHSTGLFTPCVSRALSPELTLARRSKRTRYRP